MSRRAFMAGSAVAAFSGGVCCRRAAATDDRGGASTGAPPRPAPQAPVLEDTLNFYHWAAVRRPELFKKFTDEFGP